jgi:hypothetical protein
MRISVECSCGHVEQVSGVSLEAWSNVSVAYACPVCEDLCLQSSNTMTVLDYEAPITLRVLFHADDRWEDAGLMSYVDPYMGQSMEDAIGHALDCMLGRQVEWSTLYQGVDHDAGWTITVSIPSEHPCSQTLEEVMDTWPAAYARDMLYHCGPPQSPYTDGAYEEWHSYCASL